MFEPRPVRVQAVIERPPAPPWCEVPFPERVAEWRGWLLAWRWTDATRTSWTGLVRYQREGLGYEHWVSGELLDVEPDGSGAAADGGDSGGASTDRSPSGSARPM